MVTKLSKKIISVTDGTTVKRFNISSVLAIQFKTKYMDLKYDMENIHEYASPNDQFNTLLNA